MLLAHLILAAVDMRSRLKFLDRFLTLWIFLAMLLGIGIGNLFPEITTSFQSFSAGTTNIPLAVGLILMMYPPLVKVDFSKIPSVMKNAKLLTLSFFITWVLGPLFMTLLAVLFLKGHPDYITGLVIVGIAPCIAMVIVWNELAGGSRELVAGLVGINSLLQVFFFSLYAYFYLEVVLPWLGVDGLSLNVTIVQIAETVGIYLGIPSLMAIFSRLILRKLKGDVWFTSRFIPVISPITLVALLFTVVVMFSFKGEMILQLPGDVFQIALPLVIYFATMFFLMFFVAKKAGATFKENMSLSFTASGNNFELAIAVSIGVFGIQSGQAFAGVIGPLVEVPALILLVNVSKYLHKKYYQS